MVDVPGVTATIVACVPEPETVATAGADDVQLTVGEVMGPPLEDTAAWSVPVLPAPVR